MSPLRRLPRIPAFLVLLVAIGVAVAFLAYTAVEHAPVARNDAPGEAEGPSGAFESLQMLARSRAYPAPTLQRTGYAEAFDTVQLNRARKADDDTTTWRSLGPAGFAGRMLSLAFTPGRPQTLYAGSASGGLWRSYSGGEGRRAWHRVETGYPVLGVASVVVSPADSNLILIGTGEVYNDGNTHGGLVVRETRGSYGMGILRSTDAGRTWTPTLDWSRDQQRGVQQLRFNPSNPQTVWAATTEGLYVSYDAGMTWARRLDVRMGTDVLVHPADTSLLLAACGNLGSPAYGIYRSANGGVTWTKITTGLPPEYYGKAVFGPAPSAPDTVYASIGAGFQPLGEIWNWLARSTNFGASWEVMTTDNYASLQGWYAHAVAVHPSRPEELYVGGGSFPVYHSTDGGRTLTPSQSEGLVGWADYHALAFHPADPDRLYLVNDGGVYRTTDSGATQLSLNGGLQTAQFYNGLAVSAQDPDFMIGGTQDRLTLITVGTADSGDLAWDWLGPTDGAYNAIDPRDDRIVYRGQIRSLLWRSDDRGMTWTALNTWTITRQLGFVSPFVLAPSNPDVLYAAAERVYRSSDRGALFTPVPADLASPDPILAMTVAPSDEDVVYASTTPLAERARLYRTRNAGLSWTEVTGPLPDRYLLDIAVAPDDPAAAYVAVGGFGTSHLFKTTDAGATWTSAGNGLPDVPASAALMDPLYPDTVFVGNDLGVFVSKDAGTTWAPYGEGLPEAALAMDLTVSPADRTLRVATHGNGLYARALLPAPGTAPTGRDPAEPVDVAVSIAGFPNPFSDRVTLEYRLPQPETVRLDVFDLTGRLLETLVDAPKARGTHRLIYRPQGAAAGPYVVRLTAGTQTQSRVLLRIR